MTVDLIELNYGNVTFYLTPTKLAVATKLQFFIIIASEPYFVKRLRTARMLVETGMIKSIEDLAEVSDGKLHWVSAKKEWL